MKEFPIVFACDDNYIKYTSVSIASILSNANKNFFYKIFILSENISQENQTLIREWVNSVDNFSLEFLILKDIKSEGFHIEAHLTTATYYRLYIPKLFKDYERVLYLDSDLIVDYDISKLATMDFENSLMMGVTDYVCDYVKQNNPKFPSKYFYEVLKLKEPEKYINAGVALLNIKKIYELGIEDEFIKIIHTIDKPINHDQDLLNCVIGKYGDTTLISKKYNFLTVYQNDINISYSFILKNSLYRLFNFRNTKNTPFYIYHFSTGAKPWNSSRISKRLFYKFLFSVYLINPPKKFVNQILEDDKTEYPLYWKLFLKYFSY